MSSAIQSILRIDAYLSEKLRVREASPLRILAVFFAHSGDSWFWMAGLGVLWLLLGGTEWRLRTVVMAVAIVIQAVIVLSIKFLIRRQRPEGDWGEIYRRGDPHSFPSGHATRAVMLAVLAVSLGPPWFVWVLSIWAPLVCLARVAMGVHYLTDILAGMVLGALMGVILQAFVPELVSLFPFVL
jgi:undecaprenyl-diphosphatase